LPERFMTVSEGARVRNAVCWWSDPAGFPGDWLADTSDGRGAVAIGALKHGAGRVLVIGAGAYAWDTGGALNLHGQALRRLTHNAVGYLGAQELPALASKPVWREGAVFGHWRLDRQAEPVAPAEGAERPDCIVSFPGPPSWRPGVAGEALEFNGHGTYVVGPSLAEPVEVDALGVQAWIAVRELPKAFAPVVAQRNRDAGFALGVDERGRPVARVVVDGSEVYFQRSTPAPLGEWVHLALTVSPEEGVTLYVDGEALGSLDAVKGPVDLPADVPLMIGRDPETGFADEMFPRGVFNGLIDEVRVTADAPTAAQLRKAYARKPEAAPDLSIGDRFAGDPHRPRFRAMAPTGWAHMPRALVRRDGRYALLYQANPAGPYASATQVGGLSSEDLVRWRPERAPLCVGSDGFDERGVLLGAVVERLGTWWLFYAGKSEAEGGAAVRIGAATARGDEDFAKLSANPLTSALAGDALAAPLVWRDGDREEETWRMLVAGAADHGRPVLRGFRSSDLAAWRPTGLALEAPDGSAGEAWGAPFGLPAGDDKRLLGVNVAGAGPAYWVGRWDGDRFAADAPQPTPVDLFQGVGSPAIGYDEDGQHVAIGVMSETRDRGEQLAAGWSQCFALPRRWSIDELGRLHQAPHPALKALRGEALVHPAQDLLPGAAVELRPGFGDACEVELRIDPGEATRIELSVRRSEGGAEETILGYHAPTRSLKLDRSRASLTNRYLHEAGTAITEARLRMPEDDGRVTLRVYIDRSALDYFVNDREAFGARLYPSQADAVGIRVSAHGGTAKIESLTVWPLEPGESG
ncbi:MAG: GH32 C-terminal domain-containing protein, partial [Planctomycetota bacterium]